MDASQKLPEDFLSELKSSAPSILVLGGLGFVGRHLLTLLLRNDIAQRVVVADKKIIQIAYLTADLKALIREKGVKTVQVDLGRQESVEKLFAENGPFDYVINLAAETR